MIKRNFNFLRMVKRTIDYLNENNIYWQDNIALVAIIKLIIQFYDKIDRYQEEQQLNITGYAQKKNDQKQKVILNTFAIIGSIRAYASTNNDKVLLGKVKYSRSDLWRLRDMELNNLYNTLVKICTSILDNLAEYNITQEVIDNYTSEINNYNEIIREPIKAIKRRKTATASIKIDMPEFRKIISERLDGIMEQYHLTHPYFYLGYTKHREIVDTPTHKLSLKGTVVNLNTSEPMFNVITIIPELEKETETTELGNYQFKNIKRGIYKIEFQKEGYKSITQTIEIQDTYTTELNVEMERN